MNIINLVFLLVGFLLSFKNVYAQNNALSAFLPEREKRLSREELDKGYSLLSEVRKRFYTVTGVPSQEKLGLTNLIYEWEKVRIGNEELSRSSRKKYLSLLKNIKTLTFDVSDPLKFIDIVRKAVIQTYKVNEYCSDEADKSFKEGNLIYLLNKCGSCFSLTKLYVSLFDDLQFNKRFAKDGAYYGVRLYTNHIEPVVVYQNTIYELPWGIKFNSSESDSNVYDPSIILWAYMNLFDGLKGRDRHTLITLKAKSKFNYYSTVARQLINADNNGYQYQFGDVAFVHNDTENTKDLGYSNTTKRNKTIVFKPFSPQKEAQLKKYASSGSDINELKYFLDNDLQMYIDQLDGVMLPELVKKIKRYQQIKSLSVFTTDEKDWLMKFYKDFSEAKYGIVPPSARLASQDDRKSFKLPLPFSIRVKPTAKLKFTNNSMDTDDFLYQLVFLEEDELNYWLSLSIEDRKTNVAKQFQNFFEKLFKSRGYKNLMKFYSSPYSLSDFTTDELGEMVLAAEYFYNLVEQLSLASNYIFRVYFFYNIYDEHLILGDSIAYDFKVEELLGKRNSFDVFLKKNSKEFILWLKESSDQIKTSIVKLHQIESKFAHFDRLLELYTLETSNIFVNGQESLLKYLVPSLKRKNYVPKNLKVLTVDINQDFKVDEFLGSELNLKQKENTNDIDSPFRQNALILDWPTVYTVLLMQRRSTFFDVDFQENVLIPLFSDEEVFKNYLSWAKENIVDIESERLLFSFFSNPIPKFSYESSLHIEDSRSFHEKLKDPLTFPSAYTGLPYYILNYWENYLLKGIEGLDVSIKKKRKIDLNTNPPQLAIDNYFTINGYPVFNTAFVINYDVRVDFGKLNVSIFAEELNFRNAFHRSYYRLNIDCSTKYMDVFFNSYFEKDGIGHNYFVDDIYYQLREPLPSNLDHKCDL